MCQILIKSIIGVFANLLQEEIFSSSFATAAYLDSIKFTKKAYVIGGTGIGQELNEVGISWRGIDVCYRTEIKETRVRLIFTAFIIGAYQDSR